MQTTEQFLGYDEVAQMLGVHVKTVKRWVRDGRLRPARIGVRTVRFREADVVAFLESHRTDS